MLFLALLGLEAFGPGSGTPSNVSKPYKLRSDLPARYANALKLFPTPKPHSTILALLFVWTNLDINTRCSKVFNVSDVVEVL
jgi:hypothetical protein